MRNPLGKVFLFSRIRSWRSRSVFLSDKIVWGNILTAAFLFIILLLVILFKLKPSSEQIALHYNVLVGVDIVEPGWRVYELPILPLVLNFYNLVLARTFHKIEPMASYILLIGATLVWLVFLATAISLANL